MTNDDESVTTLAAATELAPTFLDSSADTVLDGVTKLVARFLDVPIALVSLVDTDRQWFKSRFGTELREVAKDLSFCRYVVAGDSPFVVADATKDPRFATNPFVVGDPHVTFYAGLPIRARDGSILGALCAIDRQARTLTPAQTDTLMLFAEIVSERVRTYRQNTLMNVERAAALENANRLRVLFDAMDEGVLVQDREGRVLDANGAADKIFGVGGGVRNGMTVDTDLVDIVGAPFPHDERPTPTTFRTGLPTRDVVIGLRGPHATRWLSVNAYPIISAEEALPHAVVTTFHDITAQREADAAKEQLARHERLVTVGTLATGVGHEINNPLSFVASNLDFVIAELKLLTTSAASPPHCHDLIAPLVEAREGADRIRKIVYGLRALSREQSQPCAVDIEKAVDVSISMAQHAVKSHARLRKNLRATAPAFTDESRLCQILVNLIVNAGQAFQRGDLDGNEIEVSSYEREDGRIELAVRDNGPGIAPEILERIFDPFFTTKPPGEGTGLGLAICQNLAIALQSELLVETEVGRGTCFHLALPAASLHSTSTAPSVAPPASIVHRGHVLVIDDEPPILRAVGRLLGREHEVVTLTDPHEALELLTKEGGRFDLVLCDIAMPGLRGDELYAAVRASSPQIADRFVFMTGGITEARCQAFLDGISNESIDKPFDVQHLRTIVRRFVARGRER